MPREIGQRVGAISHGDGDTVYIFGFGVYEGDFVPEEGVGGFMGAAAREHNLTNPRIKLDSGKSVYGCECWWGPEDAVKQRIEGMRVVVRDIDDARAEAAAG